MTSQTAWMAPGGVLDFNTYRDAMTPSSPPRGIVRFGVFEVDLHAGELRKQGLKIRLQEQPFKILGLLLAHHGEVVTREALREQLWPSDTFVDFDHGLNKSIQKLREALGDSADNPRFVETLPRRGYRFIAALEKPASTNPSERSLDEPSTSSASRGRGRRTLALIFGAITIIALVLSTVAYFARPRPGAGASLSSGKVMLAVLPFVDMGKNPEQEYFSDGLTEEMISQLGRLRPARLGVIARTSAMQYKGTQKRIDEIAHELGVDYILEGSVRRSGDRVRITALLIQVSDQTHIWAQSYDRRPEDIFAIQNEVAGHIGRSLAVELLPAGGPWTPRVPTTSPAAHEAYLKGRYFWNKRSEEGLEKGLEYFQQAIGIDPDYALAHVGIADSYNMLADYGSRPPKDAFPHAIAAARKALALDETLAEAHTALTWARWVYELDWSAAERGFPRAIDLNPGYAMTYQLYAHYLRTQGRHEEALAEAQTARELDPLSLIINAVLGLHYYLARQPDRAIEQCRRTIEMDPSFSRVHSYLGWAYLQKGMYDDAVAELEEARALFGDSPARAAELAHAYAVAGRTSEARALLVELTELSKQKYVEAELIAKIHVALGEHNEAFEWLEKAYADRSVDRVQFKIDPLLDPLREDPRFSDLLRRIGYVDE